MLIIGITGSVAMGKSTVVKYFHELEIPVHDADACVHDLFLNCQFIIKEIGNIFPEATKNHVVDRQILSQCVFSNLEKMVSLEAIVHPKVKENRQNFIDRHRELGTPVIVVDIPLMYEGGYDQICDYVIVVACKAQEQARRALKRPGMTTEKLNKIKSLQLPIKAKIDAADYVIHTDQTILRTQEKLKGVLRDIEKRSQIRIFKEKQ